jgi:thiamine-phosphate pyrophosphorylase
VLVTDRHATGDRDLVDVVTRALDAGLPTVQLREKDLPGRPLLVLAERLRRATADRGALLFVNDRLDVALAVDADGVHLGEHSFPVAVARTLVPGLLVGASVHAVDAVAASTADFVFFGPVFATPSKAAFGAPQGIARLDDAARAASAPVLAIGGLDADTCAAALAAGAHGIAVIRAILAVPDPAAATRALLAISARKE